MFHVSHVAAQVTGCLQRVADAPKTPRASPITATSARQKVSAQPREYEVNLVCQKNQQEKKSKSFSLSGSVWRKARRVQMVKTRLIRTMVRIGPGTRRSEKHIHVKSCGHWCG